LPQVLVLKLKFLERVDASLLTLLASVFFVVAYNRRFWVAFIDSTGGATLGNAPVQIGVLLILVLLFNAALTLFSFRPLYKGLLVALFLSASATSYFMNQYGAVIDRSMIQNVLETDTREAFELISMKMLLTVSLLGILPSVLVVRSKISYGMNARGLLRKLGNVLGSVLLASVLLILLFKTLAPAVREHRELRFLLTPTNYIQAINAYIKMKLATPVVVAPLGSDAIKGKTWAGNTRKTVTVIVLGETARAMNFSLNGYQRDTNPELVRVHDLINFSNVESCGTATAVSVPCMFSALGRANYSDTQARSQQGLLDVLSHAGFEVLWRDNNSGCKSVCDRVAYEDMSRPVAGDALCNEEDCYDERLLEGVPAMMRGASRDLVIVLHQKGSHGPAYAKRYPAGFDRFGPVCETNELQKCSQESIVAAYDNSILYTDHFLARTIAMLRAGSEDDGIDTALLYVSDHGESLGEKNMYLHGAPYIIAPPEQTRVPLMLWMSAQYSSRFGIDRTCLAARASQPFSHDNLFHSVLGMLNVNTAVFNPRLDLFGACTHGA
jgi:lipid A ethanolaminephosphotransferase